MNFIILIKNSIFIITISNLIDFIIYLNFDLVIIMIKLMVFLLKNFFLIIKIIITVIIYSSLLLQCLITFSSYRYLIVDYLHALNISFIIIIVILIDLHFQQIP